MGKQRSISYLQETARKIRIEIIKMITKAGSGHPAGSLGITDVLVALFFGKLLKYDPQKPDWSNRDRLVLSAGHLCPALYAALAFAGFFHKENLKTLRKLDSPLQGHPEFGSLPGIETTSGSLGQGLSIACGMALAAKMNKKDYKVVCLTSDGEHDEGQLWEAVMLANKYKIGNLINIVDRNKIQIDGTTCEIMPLEPLAKKYQAFGWQVFEIDGHNFEEIIKTFKKASNYKKGPVVIIAKTIAGKGVSFMEGRFEWHGKTPTWQEAKKATEELAS